MSDNYQLEIRVFPSLIDNSEGIIETFSRGMDAKFNLHSLHEAAG